MNKRRFVRYLLQEPYSFVILLRNIIHPPFRYLPMCLELRPDVAFAASRRLWLCVGTYDMLRRDVILWNSITIIPPFARY